MVLKQHAKKVIYVTIGILILLLLYSLKNTSYFVRVTTFIFAILLFYVADIFFKLGFKNHHYFILILISAAGILLSPLYFISPNYDKVLHLTFPILISLLVFFLINKTELKLSTKLLLTFSVVIMSLAIFEIGEFLLDKMFDLKLQGVFLRDVSGVEKLNIIMDRNDDTMIDLILGTIGSLLFVGYKSLVFNFQECKKRRQEKKKKKK